MSKRLTTEDFIEKAKLVHGNRYDYSLVEYMNTYTKVKIICGKHGIFEQTPNCHLDGKNCSKCMDKKSTTDDFINKARLVHGDKYNYSLIAYKNNKSKIEIVCSEHGSFIQEPLSHLKGNGCPKCSGFNKTTKDFIDRGKSVHGDKYDYTLVEYIGIFNKVKVICPIHGEFKQTPQHHLRGSGCPICNESKGEKQIRKFLKENNIDFISQYVFNDCRDIKVLPFDFYLPEFNTCIEYDGRQHFVEIKKWGGKEGLIDQQKKDKIKTDYCINNNLSLIRFSYLDDLSIEIPIKLGNINIYSKAA